MESIQSRVVKINKDGVMIVKTTYQKFNHSLGKNTKSIKWSTSFKGEFAQGYSMKKAVQRVMKQVENKTAI